MREPLFRPLQRARQLAAPLRDRKAQLAHERRQALSGKRCVGADHHVDEAIDPRLPRRFRHRSRAVLVRGVDADPALAAYHAQEATVVHDGEQMRGGVRQAAPVVRYRAVREMVVDLARMDGPARAHEVEEELRPFPA